MTMNSAMRDADGASRGTDEPAAPIRRSQDPKGDCGPLGSVEGRRGGGDSKILFALFGRATRNAALVAADMARSSDREFCMYRITRFMTGYHRSMEVIGINYHLVVG